MTSKTGRLSLAMATLALCLIAPMAFACAAPAESSAWKRSMVEWVNVQRQAQGKPALALDGKLARAAQGHACAMAASGQMVHQIPGGPDFVQRLNSEGYRPRAGAENIAKMRSAGHQRTAEIWQNSPPHWANILNAKVNEIGIGLAMAEGRYYWVMDVGREK